MSMWYFVAGVLILKRTVSPGLTLIDVANPWIVVDPAPVTCQVLGASPGLLFSQAMTLVTGGPQGSAARAAGTPTAMARRSVTTPRTAMRAARGDGGAGAMPREAPNELP